MNSSAVRPSAAANLLGGSFHREGAAISTATTVANCVTETIRDPCRKRSRSPTRGQDSSDGEVSPSPLRQSKSKPETEAVSRKDVLEGFSVEVLQRFKDLESDGTMRPADLDENALVALQSLAQPLQLQVFDHLEANRIFFINARSRSGFLVSLVDKARSGALDARGFSLTDPWRAHLLSIARPKCRLLDLVPEEKWLSQHGQEPARLVIDISSDKEAGANTITLAVALTQTAAALKKRLEVIGVKIPIGKMRIKSADAGFLKDSRTLAYYNLKTGSQLQLHTKTRAGIAHKRDHSDGYDPKFCEVGFY